MDEIQYLDISFKQVDIWKDELDSLEYCYKAFGSLGYILHEYYQTYDIELFEKYKSIIESNFVDALIGRNSVPTFFGKTEKILMLKKYWDQNKKWRDPIVARLVGTKNDLPFYYLHPGRDRFCIMKGLGLTQYSFLYIPQHLLTDNNYDHIKSFWGDYGNTLVIKPSEKDKNRTVLGNHDTDQYTKYKNLIDWLKQ